MDLSPNVLRFAYAEGRLTPVDVMEFVLSRLDDDDQEGVWTSTVDPDRALKAAQVLTGRLDGLAALPLFGLPFSVKDNIDVAGEPTSAACPAFEYTADTSAYVVQQALDAGALYVGKTNMDQFATGLVGVRTPYGVARNPFNPDYISGGSSSGAGVSVSTGVVSFAFGTDTGGSGRVPASYNGIAGLKPAPGLLSRRGLVFACRSIDTPSVFAATAADTVQVFDAVSSFDSADPFARPPCCVARAKGERTAPKIAVPRAEDLRFFGNAEVEAMFAEAVHHASALFGQPDRVDFTPFTDLNDLMFFGPLLAERDVSIGAFIDENAEACDPTVRALVQNSRKLTAAEAYRGLYKVADAKAATQPFWGAYDILMVPTVGTVLTKADLLADPLGPNFNNGYYTNYANPLGLTAIATPFGTTSAGVPWGVTLLVDHTDVGALAKVADQFSSTAASAA